MTTDGETVTTYGVNADGTLEPLYECAVSATSYACSIDGVEEFRTLSDPGWLEYPLPEGDLVYVPPFGWWVVQGDTVVPADAIAASYSDAPLAIDEFVLLTPGGGDGPAGMPGVTWDIIVLATVLLGCGVAALVFWARSRRGAA